MSRITIMDLEVFYAVGLTASFWLPEPQQDKLPE